MRTIKNGILLIALSVSLSCWLAGVATAQNLATDNVIVFVKADTLVLGKIVECYNSYLTWCRDTVQKRGFDSYTPDTSSYKTDAGGNKLYFLMKSVPNYYRDQREEPTFYGFMDWLGKKRLATSR